MKEEFEQSATDSIRSGRGNLSCHPDCGVRGYVPGSGYTPCTEMNMKQPNSLH